MFATNDLITLKKWMGGTFQNDWHTYFLWFIHMRKKAGANRNSKETLNFKETVVEQVFKIKRQNTLLLHAMTLTRKTACTFECFLNWCHNRLDNISISKTIPDLVMVKVWLGITWHRWFHVTKHWKVQLETVWKKAGPFQHTWQVTGQTLYLSLSNIG